MEGFIDGVQHAGEEVARRGKKFAEEAIDTVDSKAKEMAPTSRGVRAGEHSEGTLTKQIESMTSRIPSATFLSLAVASVGLAALFRIFGRKDDAQFVGHWVPTILTLGLYNKLIKLEGSE